MQGDERCRGSETRGHSAQGTDAHRQGRHQEGQVPTRYIMMMSLEMM